MNLKNFKWTREPNSFKIENDKIEIITKPRTDLWQRTYYHFRNDNAPVYQIITKPRTDLWQRTYYHFRNDNAPVYQMETEEKHFSFVVKTEFKDSNRSLMPL